MGLGDKIFDYTLSIGIVGLAMVGGVLLQGHRDEARMWRDVRRPYKKTVIEEDGRIKTTFENGKVFYSAPPIKLDNLVYQSR